MQGSWVDQKKEYEFITLHTSTRKVLLWEGRKKLKISQLTTMCRIIGLHVQKMIDNNKS